MTGGHLFFASMFPLGGWTDQKVVVVQAEGCVKLLEHMIVKAGWGLMGEKEEKNLT